MKNLTLLLVLFLCLNARAQYLSGIYSGKLVNDSTKREQNYQLALSEYKGKITGYAYTTFVVNDTFYYSIKRIKATRGKGELIVEDVKMIANNFPESPAKRVKQTNRIPLNESMDTIISLNGTWSTNQTKEYYSLHGALDMQKDVDSANSPLIAHLSELNLIPPISASGVGPEALAAANKNAGAGNRTGGTASTSAKSNNTTAGNTGSGNTASGNTKASEGRTTTAKTGSGNKGTSNTSAQTTNATGSGTTTATGTASADQNTEKKPADDRNSTAGNNNRNNRNNKSTTPPVLAPEAIPYHQRGQVVLQQMDMAADSITLSFYDNGVVDGDMISVYINGQNIIPPTKLTEAATKRTVSLKSFNTDSVELTLVAETLGTLPPNTGLLVVQEGARRYEVRFSADLQTNAAIVFRKRK